MSRATTGSPTVRLNVAWLAHNREDLAALLWEVRRASYSFEAHLACRWCGDATQHTPCADVLIDIRPVHAFTVADDLEILTLLLSGVRQSP